MLHLHKEYFCTNTSEWSWTYITATFHNSNKDDLQFRCEAQFYTSRDVIFRFRWARGLMSRHDPVAANLLLRSFMMFTPLHDMLLRRCNRNWWYGRGSVAHEEDMTHAHGKPERIRPYGRNTYRWQDNNKIDAILIRVWGRGVNLFGAC
jgi:hypothetical protein